MMGSGKSAIGKVVSSILDVRFIDADVEIERAAKLSIPEIFERHGEQFFRDKEDQIIKRLLQEKPCILATGGGAFINKKIRTSMKEYGVSVWLNADLEILWNRVKHKKSRPLLRTDNPKETFDFIFNELTNGFADLLKLSGVEKLEDVETNIYVKTLPKYMGEYKDDKKHGYGIYKWADGRLYLG